MFTVAISMGQVCELESLWCLAGAFSNWKHVLMDDQVTFIPTLNAYPLLFAILTYQAEGMSVRICKTFT